MSVPAVPLALVAVLVALAVLAVRGPRARGAQTVAARGGIPADGRDRRTARASPHDATELAAAVTAVASAVRAGSAPGRAWLAVAGLPAGPDGVPALADLVPADGLGRVRRRLVPGAGRRQAAHVTDVRRAAAVVAAGRLAAELGAPLAPVLDRVAATIAADAELDGERAAALAGPRSTATVLAWLPALGVVLGMALGADPVAVVLGGGLGTTSAALGCVLLVAGRAWTARMLRTARRAGGP